MTELLDLSTVVERDTVRIRTKKNVEGKLYELRNLDELGPFEHQTIISRYATVATLGQRSDRKLTAKEKANLRRVLGDILKLLLPDLEPHVLGEMEDVVRAQIVTAWTVKHGTDGAAEGEALTSPSPTAGSSRGSKRSTAATKKPGSISRAGR